uniref:hypothetical protein n=1 Tax=Pseudonocardia dioxanivorans TaxID=240495 RepID=UPI0003050CE2|nr:hypothetical protein [Pseudonocardia dioxanivorans]
MAWALADPKLDERHVLMAVLDHDPALTTGRTGLTIIADKGYVSRELDAYLAERGVMLLRPSYRNRAPRPGVGAHAIPRGCAQVIPQVVGPGDVLPGGLLRR